MFYDWIHPVREELLAASLTGVDNIGSSIFLSPQNESVRSLAFIGVDGKWADRIRMQLYRFANTYNNLDLVDLGNLKHPDNTHLYEVLRICAENPQVLPVFLGLRQDQSRSISKMIREISPSAQSMFVQESFPAWLTRLQPQEEISFLGLQRHLIDKNALRVLDHSSVAWKRLSAVRDTLDETEPEIRDCAYFNFDVSAIRFSDFPAQISRSTSGFYTEEACRLMRYAGSSPSMRFVSISGHDPLSIQHAQSANTAAQLLWYLGFGVDNKIMEAPGKGDRFVQYIIHLQRYDFDLAFHKSKASGRWWLELPTSNGSRVFSCAYGDYLASCENVVTDRVAKCIESTLQIIQD